MERLMTKFLMIYGKLETILKVNEKRGYLIIASPYKLKLGTVYDGIVSSLDETLTQPLVVYKQTTLEDAVGQAKVYCEIDNTIFNPDYPLLIDSNFFYILSTD